MANLIGTALSVSESAKNRSVSFTMPLVDAPESPVIIGEFGISTSNIASGSITMAVGKVLHSGNVFNDIYSVLSDIF